MNIGFDARRINELFCQIDADGGGTIDAEEFIRHLFPKTFHEIYSQQFDSEDGDESQAASPSRTPSQFSVYSRNPSDDDVHLEV